MKPTLNLASRRYLNRRATNRVLLVAGMVLTVFAALQGQSYLQGQQQIDRTNKNIESLERKLTLLQGDLPQHLTASRIEAQKAEFAEAERLLKRDAFRWTALFDKMERQLPSGVSVDSFQPDYNKNSLELIGVAKKLSDLQRLLDRLLADSFAQVFLKNQSLVDVDDGMEGKKSAHQFVITIEGVF